MDIKKFLEKCERTAKCTEDVIREKEAMRRIVERVMSEFQKITREEYEAQFGAVKSPLDVDEMNEEELNKALNKAFDFVLFEKAAVDELFSRLVWAVGLKEAEAQIKLLREEKNRIKM